ncbi:MAG: transporter substrate-binding domain-containing protein [Planctomycetota bacterium]|jgi:polar amino acid transport system substrate-binding protein
MKPISFLLGLIVGAAAAGGGAWCLLGSGGAGPGGGLVDGIRERGVLRVGVKADAPPLGWQDEFDRYGFDVDIAEAVFGELKGPLGLEKIEFVTVTSSDRIAKVVSGEIDMAVATMTITRSRDEEVDFTIPYFQDGQALLVRADSEIRSYMDLAGKTVGVVKGATSGPTIRQVQPDCTVREYADYDATVAGLLAGEVEAVTSDMLILMGLRLRSADPEKLRIAGERFSTEPYGIAVAEDQSEWRDELNGAIQRLWLTGRWQRIYENWFGESAKYSTDVEFAVEPYPE